MGGRCLRDLVVRARLDGVDQVGEPDGVLDEEDGNVVSDNVWFCQSRPRRELSRARFELEYTDQNCPRRCNWSKVSFALLYVILTTYNRVAKP